MSLSGYYQGAVLPAKALVMARKLTERRRPALIICNDQRRAETVFSDLSFFAPNLSISLFSSWDTLPFEPVSPSLSISASRIQTLFAIHSDDHLVVVAPIQALLQRFIPFQFLEALRTNISVNSKLERRNLINRFEGAGFIRVPVVEALGQFAVRGGVIDIFPFSEEQPVRLLFKGDLVDSILSFSPDSQRTDKSSKKSFLEVLPIWEFLAPSELVVSKELAEAMLQKLTQKGKERELPQREFLRILSQTRAGSKFPGMELVSLSSLDRLDSLFDVIPKGSLWIMDNEFSISHTVDQFGDILQERALRFETAHSLTPTKDELFVSREEFLSVSETAAKLVFDRLDITSEEDAASQKVRTGLTTELAIRLKARVGTGEALKPLKEAVDKYRRKNFAVAFVVGSKERADRLQRLLLDVDIDARLVYEEFFDWTLRKERLPVTIFIGRLSDGFFFDEESIVCIAEQQLFGERSQAKRGKRPANLKRLLKALAQLKDNDYIVHVDYGIGLYRGLIHLEIEETKGDFLTLEYADSRLYLPIQQIGKIQKFMASEGQVPSLDKLSSTRWQKTKQKVKESLIVLAGDLIKLYAKRAVAKGWRYAPFNAEDERFAESFPFQETPDQQKAIEETLSDMASDRPMDRLICGDVGFGKTEVAIRAAYKAVEHGRQVALLVPTTILVEQHRDNFASRFVGYPVSIGALSRFYSPQQNRETLKKLSSGEIDIVIGTHKLLSQGVTFQDLGLVIIDEEHRFGVKQKERLKQLKNKVDVLTLTATPIPRTLHMSLLDIRDMSVIQTAPTERKITRTYVASYDENLIRDAVLRELQRGGQIFFVHNRVQGIENVAARISELIPEAKVEFAHGQMHERKIEDILQRFLAKEIDVLVTTTIIESGIDIPNANTIIVDNAVMYGLAQLYQLRGRVGRGTQQAYAYFLVPKARKLGAEAQQRLRVLQSLDDLGVGFHLAMRDLEIRGTGNLLGKEQSGSVVSVGFELYSKILQEAILHVKGEEDENLEIIEPEVKLPTVAFIGENYVPDISERLILYQRFAALSDPEEVTDLLDELNDRFGPPLPEVEEYAELMRLRALLRQFRVLKLEAKGDKILISFSPTAPIDGTKLLTLVQRNPARYKLGKSLILAISVQELEMNSREVYNLVLPLLCSLEESKESGAGPELVVPQLAK